MIYLGMSQANLRWYLRGAHPKVIELKNKDRVWLKPYNISGKLHIYAIVSSLVK